MTEEVAKKLLPNRPNVRARRRAASEFSPLSVRLFIFHLIFHQLDGNTFQTKFEKISATHSHWTEVLCALSVALFVAAPYSRPMTMQVNGLICAQYK